MKQQNPSEQTQTYFPPITPIMINITKEKKEKKDPVAVVNWVF